MAVRCVTRALANSWVQINLHGVRLKLSHYTVRHYSTWDLEALRFWRIEASNDGISWTILRQHDNDTSLHGAGIMIDFSSSCFSLAASNSLFRLWLSGLVLSCQHCQQQQQQLTPRLSGFRIVVRALVQARVPPTRGPSNHYHFPLVLPCWAT